MENENFDGEENLLHEEDSSPSRPGKNRNSYAIPAAILIAGAMLSGALMYNSQKNRIKTEIGENQSVNANTATSHESYSASDETVIPSGGVELPVSWGDLGAKLASVGAINAEKFKSLYEKRGQFTDEYKNLLFENNEGKLRINKDNAGYLLNLFWALGLANNNPILSEEMSNKIYGGAENFASTAGWTMATGNPMNHYNRHRFFNLTPEQQALVDKISRGIYRPCCDNSTHLPDCNHGMAMLGLLELMASQGASEQDMWKAALAANSYWFPDEYIVLAAYMKNKGAEWRGVNPKAILSADYSSASGFSKIASQTAVSGGSQGGSGCGVYGEEEASATQIRQGGCGI